MTGDSRLRVGGWIGGAHRTSDGSPPVPVTDGIHPVIDSEPLGTVADAWQPAEIPDPDAGAAGDDDGRYRGRRRLIGPLRPAARLRRLAVAAVAVGTLLVVGTSVLVGLFLADRETQLAPPPTPGVADQDPDGDVDRRAAVPPARPGASPSATPSPSPARVPVETSLEAEAAELGGSAQVVDFGGAAGGELVRLSGNRDGTFVRFTGVSAVASGQYEVTIGYFSDQDHPGAISVNDGEPATVTFPSRGEGGSVGVVVVTVQLASGGNTIQVSSSGGAPLSIDRIVVTG